MEELHCSSDDTRVAVFVGRGIVVAVGIAVDTATAACGCWDAACTVADQQSIIVNLFTGSGQGLG